MHLKRQITSNRTKLADKLLVNALRTNREKYEEHETYGNILHLKCNTNGRYRQRRQFSFLYTAKLLMEKKSIASSREPRKFQNLADALNFGNFGMMQSV